MGDVEMVRARQRPAIQDLWRLLKWQACLASCPAQQCVSPSHKVPHSATCPEGLLRRAIRDLDGSTKPGRPPGPMPAYRCGVCGETGHNARRHQP